LSVRDAETKQIKKSTFVNQINCEIKLESFDIELYKSNQEFVKQTVTQILKDFGMFGIDLSFTGNTHMAYTEMSSQLAHQVSRLLMDDAEKLKALLYQIDLSQDKIFTESQTHADWPLEEVIAELIIHRELKKVLIRNYFKQNPDKL
jgi:hypothetical protein